MRCSLIISIVTTVILCIPLLLLRETLLTLFTDDPIVIQYGSRFIGIIAPFYFTVCFNQTFAGAMRGIGKANVPMIVMLSSFVLFRQIYLFAGTRLGGGFVTVALAYPMGWVVCSLLMAICFRRSALCHPEKDRHEAVAVSVKAEIEDANEGAE